MKIYFGGAYNGKLKLVCEKYKINKEEICFCKDTIDFDKKVICGLDKFILENSIKGNESFNYILKNISKLKGKIIIVDQISEGIVPIKKEERLWREETGRIMQYLIKEGDEVYRVFFGIEKKMK